MTGRPVPPADEAALGLATYLTDAPGIGGRLRTEPEDFQVLELGDGPRPAEDGHFAAARIRLRNWETNRFVAKAAQELNLGRGKIAFAGMKDKRAVTEQWFTFKCPPERIRDLERLQDVEVVGTPYVTRSASYAGAHAGNRFVLRVRDHNGDREAVDAITAAVRDEGGVPNLFGPQRFGGGVRPVTHRMGRAIVAGDLEEAVRLYVGHPFEGERAETYQARRIYESTRDAEAALAAFPAHLDLERGILQRLQKRPGEWRYALMALPHNLLQLFVHSWQSYLFNHTVSARIDAGLGLNRAHVGDRVMAGSDDGTRTVAITPRNQARVQQELDRGRAVLTAPLIGTGIPLSEGEPGAIEERILAEHDVDPTRFRCRELPQVASDGRRRGILQPVRDLEVQWVEDDPVLGFALGRGAYATVVLREFLKADLDAY